MSSASSPKFLEELKRRPIDAFISGLVEIPADSTLPKIIGLLKERGVYEVFLVEGARCGTISARDILRVTNIETTKPPALISHVPVLDREASVGEVARLMADYRIKAVPISDGHRIIGQANAADLLHEVKGKLSGDMRITSIATKNPVTVNAATSLVTARDLMIRKRIDHLPVTGERRLTGILTSANIVARMTPPERVGSKSMKPEIRGSLHFPAGDAMDPTPLTCAPEASVDRALDLVLNNSKTCILITQWDELQAIATHRDFMTLLAETEPEPEVPISMIGLPDDPFEAEAAKTKFKRTVNQLYRILPDILEARSVIKSKFSKPGKDRRRYEVKVHVRTPKDTHTYSEGGWDLPAIYDIITERLKRLLTQKQKRRRIREKQST